MNPLEEYPIHKELLDKIFSHFDKNQKYKILDAGSGRTSLYYLTTTFPNSFVEAFIYPGDERKKGGIERDVGTTNFKLEEIDIQNYKQKEDFDIVLAHLLLGEATKFNQNSFENVLNALFNIKTKHLVIVDIYADPQVNYGLLLKNISDVGRVIKLDCVDKYIGMVVERKN